jgi:hypothetical protein
MEAKYTGFCTRQDLGGTPPRHGLGTWFDDLLGLGTKTKSDVENAAREESSLTLWKIAALGSLTVAAILYFYKISSRTNYRKHSTRK